MVVCRRIQSGPHSRIWLIQMGSKQRFLYWQLQPFRQRGVRNLSMVCWSRLSRVVESQQKEWNWRILIRRRQQILWLLQQWQTWRGWQNDLAWWQLLLWRVVEWRSFRRGLLQVDIKRFILWLVQRQLLPNGDHFTVKFVSTGYLYCLANVLY